MTSRKDNTQISSEGGLPAPGRRAPLWPLLVMGLLMAAAAALTWRKWPDTLVDFGRELYTPRQLSQAHVLYRDIFHLYGPLSQYFNALLFFLFGASFTTLIYANLLWISLFVLLLYFVLGRIFHYAASGVCCIVFLVLFAFGYYVSVGNYNYVAPYSHEATHGLILSFVLLTLLWLFARQARTWLLVSAGFVLGLVLLTRLEVAVAALAGSLCLLLLTIAQRRPGARKAAGWIGVYGIAALVPSLLFVVFLSRHMPVSEAIGGCYGSWAAALDPRVNSTAFFKLGMGTDQPVENLQAMGLYFLAACGMVYVMLQLSPLAGSSSRHLAFRILAGLGLLGMAAVPCLAPFALIARPMPLLVILGATFLLVSWFKARRKSPQQAEQLAFAISLAVFGLALAAKMLLFCRIWHYGFYLALPATIFLCLLGMWFVPGRMARGGSRAFQLALCATLAIIAVRGTMIAADIYGHKNYPVADGGDRMYAFSPRLDPRGPIVDEALAWMKQNLSADATVAGFPEAIMLNYLSRHRDPCRYTQTMTTEVLMFGEDRILAGLAQSDPDYVMLVHKDSGEFGVGLFGRDERYGLHIVNWINEHYAPVALFGAEPLTDGRFGIKILRKKPVEK